MNFGNKFGAWVFFHTAFLQYWEFQENLGQTVAELPLSQLPNPLPPINAVRKQKKN